MTDTPSPQISNNRPALQRPGLRAATAVLIVAGFAYFYWPQGAEIQVGSVRIVGQTMGESG